MNKNLTEIAFVLDRSGSMESMKEQAITGFNHFLADQVSHPGDARLTLVLFDDEYLVPVAAKSLHEVPPLDSATYVPRNTTALLDAIGQTIDEIGQRLANTPEPERPGQVIVAILTDGLENASTRYTWADIAGRIKHQHECYHWQFLFLGANQDAIATAARMHIHQANAATLQDNAAGYAQVAPHSLSRKIKSMRRHAATGVAEADLDKPLQTIVAEEESGQTDTRS